MNNKEIDNEVEVIEETAENENIEFNEQEMADSGLGEESEESDVVENLGELFAAESDEASVKEVKEEVIEEPVPENLGELEQFEAADIEEEEEEEFIPTEQVESIIESLLFVSDKPLSISAIKQAFRRSNVSTKQIKKAINTLEVEFASAHRGVTLEQVSGGYRLHTKVDNMDYLRRTVKERPFKLSGPAMEVMSIAAYKQPIVKAEIDEIRGVESGHLLRALMDKGLVCFAGKSELPGKPMLYGTTRKFLETFSLKSLKDLPTLSEIDELLPEGIGEEEEKPTLDVLTESLSEEVAGNYSEGENELLKITDQLSQIETSSDFFEEEKRRQKEKRDADRAQDLLEALEVGEPIEAKDQRWLTKYQEAQELATAEAAAVAVESAIEEVVSEETETEELALDEASDVPIEDLEVAVEHQSDFEVMAAEKAIEDFESDEAGVDIDRVSNEAIEAAEVMSEFEGKEGNDDINELDAALADLDGEEEIKEEVN